MIAKEVQYRLGHYAGLALVLSILFAVFLTTADPAFRNILAVSIGSVYVLWGMWTHQGELKTTRLVLEYVAIGCLGAVILIVLTGTL